MGSYKLIVSATVLGFCGLVGVPSAQGQSDCNTNLIPDDCDIDCGVPGGPCDLPGCGLSLDCNINQVPDECDVNPNDPDGDGVVSDDVNGNGIPDECEFGLQACCCKNLATTPPYSLCAELEPTYCSSRTFCTPMGPDSHCVGDGPFEDPIDHPFKNVDQEDDACGAIWCPAGLCIDGVFVPPGSDEFVTPPDGAEFDFCQTCIPADFFGPGSLPFCEILPAGGAGPPDTIVKRCLPDCLDGPCATFGPVLPSRSNQDPIPVKLVHLDLESSGPIAVDFCDGTQRFYDVHIATSSSGLGTSGCDGEMEAIRTHEYGGVFHAEFPVQGVFTFTRVGVPSDIYVFDTYAEGLAPINMATRGFAPFTFVPDPVIVASVSVNLAPNFVPALETDPDTEDQCCKDVEHSANTAFPGLYPSGHKHKTGLDCADCFRGACCTNGFCSVTDGLTFCEAVPPVGLNGTYMGNGTNCDDADSDGLPDVFESNDCCLPFEPCATRTDPNAWDTDGDGCGDGYEVQVGNDPCDPCDLPPGCTGPLLRDCNTNLVPDECDIAAGNSQDCNANGIPDECEPGMTDGNTNGVTDQCEFGLMITELVDGPLFGGQPKWVELTNCGSADVGLSEFTIGNFNNGSLDLPGGGSEPLFGVLAPGDSYIVAYENSPSPPAISTFEDVYGVAPGQFVGPLTNGNDVIALFLGPADSPSPGVLNGTIYDIYGVRGVDGTGRRWEYTDGYASRDPMGTPSGTFNSNGWYFAGPDSLEDSDPLVERQLLQDLTHPYSYDCGLAFCDCNSNGIDDAIDLAGGTSNDCNTNALPDECETLFEDYDNDRDVDLDDYAALYSCLAGPDVVPNPPGPGCADLCLEAFDSDGDDDVDLLDASVFQDVFGLTVSTLQDVADCSQPFSCVAPIDEKWCYYNVTSFRAQTQAQCTARFGMQPQFTICLSECPIVSQQERCPPLLLKDVATGCLFSVSKGAGCASCEGNVAGGRWRLLNQ